MRHLRLMLVAFLVVPSTGCNTLRDWFGIPPRPPAPPHQTGAVPKVTAEQLVGYINTQADRLQNISYGEVTLSAKQGDGIKGALKEMVYPNLRGNLSASQPRNFRMVAKGGLVDVKVDLGSNPEQFWVYFTAPQEQMFVFASHSDFESGKAKIPGHMPVDPDLIMQALGMTTFRVDAAYEEVTTAGNPLAAPAGHQKTVPINERDRTYTLRWSATLPNGMQVRKEIIFAADDADASRNQPQVKKHLIRDLKGKVICSAEIKAARTIPSGGSDPRTGRAHVVQYPTEVVLRWEEQKFEMTLKLDAARVNQQLTPQDTRRLFDLPNIPGANPVNLAEARFGNR